MLNIKVDVHIHAEPDRTDQILTLLAAVQSALQGVQEELTRSIERGDVMSQALERLTTEVAEMKTVNESAIALLGNLSQQIRDLKDEPAALEQLANDLDAQANALAAAVSENTPAAG